MHHLRRAAVKAISTPTSSSITLLGNTRTFITRTTTSSSICRSSLSKSQGIKLPPSSFLTRTYATDSEQVPQAAEETAESVQEVSADTAEKGSEAAENIEDKIAGKAAQAKDTLSNAASGAAAAAEAVTGATDTSTASSAQSTPIRNEGVTTPPGSQSNKTLYCGNLFFETTAAELKREFERFGEIEESNVVLDSRGLSKGFGYVTFKNDQEARGAQEEMHGQVFEGRRMTVQFAIRTKAMQLGTSRGGGVKARPMNPPSKTLFVGNMSYEMTDKDLNSLFRELKNVLDVRVAIDRRTGQPRGFAHADFVDIPSAEKAAELLKGKAPRGRTLRVDFSHSVTSGAREASPTDD